MSNTGEDHQGNAMRTIRENQDWTRKEMAEKLGVSERTVEGWEHGRQPSKTIIILLEKLT